MKQDYKEWLKDKEEGEEISFEHIAYILLFFAGMIALAILGLSF